MFKKLKELFYRKFVLPERVTQMEKVFWPYACLGLDRNLMEAFTEASDEMIKEFQKQWKSNINNIQNLNSGNGYPWAPKNYVLKQTGTVTINGNRLPFEMVVNRAGGSNWRLEWKIFNGDCVFRKGLKVFENFDETLRFFLLTTEI